MALQFLNYIIWNFYRIAHDYIALIMIVIIKTEFLVTIKNLYLLYCK